MFGFDNGGGNTVYSLEVPGRKGLLGLSACPGVRLETLKRGNPVRNLKRDIAAYQEWGASGVLTLVEEHELEDVGIPNLGDLLQEAGFWWRHLPIVDMNVPTSEFEHVWSPESQQIRASLALGERIVIHCWAGLGRTGLIAARILVESGMSPEMAIVQVRRVRPRAIQTQEQEEYVRSFARASMRRSRDDRWSRLHRSQG